MTITQVEFNLKPMFPEQVIHKWKQIDGGGGICQMPVVRGPSINKVQRRVDVQLLYLRWLRICTARSN